jgi:hypothetical protein
MADHVDRESTAEWVHWRATDRISMTLNQQVGALYEQLRLDVFRYILALGLPPHMAQDITHDSFIRLYETLHRGAAVENPRAWLLRVAHNLAVNQKAGRLRYGDCCLRESRSWREDRNQNRSEGAFPAGVRHAITDAQPIERVASDTRLAPRPGESPIRSLAKSLVVPLVGAGIGERPLVDHFALLAMNVQPRFVWIACRLAHKNMCHIVIRFARP